MKQSVNINQFMDAFRQMGREDQFSYEGKEALFEWFEQLEEDTGTESELDVIALCCEFIEYKNLKELQQNYNDIETMEDVEEHTQVIKIPDSEGFIIRTIDN